MLRYTQSVHTTIFKYIENEFEHILETDNGERIESNSKENIKIKTSDSLFLDQNLRLTVSNKYIKELKNILISIKKELLTQNIRFSAFMLLRNEKVLINENNSEDKIDDRSYGFIKIILRDSTDNNAYMNDITVTKSDPENLEKKIYHSVKKNLQIIKFKSEATCTKICLKSVPVVLSSQSAGYFIHEIFGHTLESDFFSFYEEKYKNLIVPKKLTVKDSAEGFETLTGIGKYDDVGTEIKSVTLVADGRVCNILSIDKNLSFDNKLYGTARRENYKSDVMPRMRATYILPFDDMGEQDVINKYNNGIFINSAHAGGINPQTGDYNLFGDGFVIKNGKKQNFVGNLKLSGNIINDLFHLEYVGNDFKMFGSYCIKFDQTVRVGIGGVTTSISEMNVEGNVYG